MLWKGEPMRKIDADALKEEIDYYIREAGWGETRNEALRWCLEFIDNQPTIEPERKKGKWIKTGQSFIFPEKFRNYSCSECGYDVDKTKFNFCPNCGAYIMEEQDDNNIHASVGPAIMPSGDHG